MIQIPPCEPIDHVEPVAIVEIIFRPFEIDVERHLIHGHVDRSPPNVVLGIRVPDNALVFWRPTGLVARVGDQCARVGNHAVLFAANRLLLELGRCEITHDVLDPNIVCLKTETVHHDSLKSLNKRTYAGDRQVKFAAISTEYQDVSAGCAFDKDGIHLAGPE